MLSSGNVWVCTETGAPHKCYGDKPCLQAKTLGLQGDRVCPFTGHCVSGIYVNIPEDMNSERARKIMEGEGGGDGEDFDEQALAENQHNQMQNYEWQTQESISAANRQRWGNEQQKSTTPVQRGKRMEGDASLASWSPSTSSQAFSSFADSQFTPMPMSIDEIVHETALSVTQGMASITSFSSPKYGRVNINKPENTGWLHTAPEKTFLKSHALFSAITNPSQDLKQYVEDTRKKIGAANTQNVKNIKSPFLNTKGLLGAFASQAFTRKAQNLIREEIYLQSIADDPLSASPDERAAEKKITMGWGKVDFDKMITTVIRECCVFVASYEDHSREQASKRLRKVAPILRYGEGEETGSISEGGWEFFTKLHEQEPHFGALVKVFYTRREDWIVQNEYEEHMDILVEAIKGCLEVVISSNEILDGIPSPITSTLPISVLPRGLGFRNFPS